MPVTVVAVALLGSAPAQADSDKETTTIDSSISATIEEFGKSLCPSLVKPGSSLASALSEMQGNTGLTPTLTGMVAGLAIQMHCPAFMSKLAEGDLSLSELKLPDGATPDIADLLRPLEGLDGVEGLDGLDGRDGQR